MKANTTNFIFNGTRTTSRLSPTYVYDSRDNFLNPTKGWRHVVATDIGGLGGAKFTRSMYEITYYHPLIGKLVGAGHARINFAEGYEELPFSRGRINDYREMPNWIGKWLVGFYPIKSLHVGVRNQVSSSWLSSTIINSELSENYRVDGYYTLDVLVNYSVSDKIRLLANFFNVNDAKYGGISAVNDVGFLRGNGSEPFTESLYLNPQYGARFTLGVDISL